MTRAESFWSHVDAGASRTTAPPLDPEPHWTWCGSRNAEGRPLTWHKGKLRAAYRVAWELMTDTLLTPDEELHATCEVSLCVNPAHRQYFRRAPKRPLLFRGSKAAAEFRLDLDNAYLNAGENYCTQGHVLRPGVRRSDCPECRNARRRRAKVSEHESIHPTPGADSATDPTDAPQIDLPALPF